MNKCASCEAYKTRLGSLKKALNTATSHIINPPIMIESADNCFYSKDFVEKSINQVKNFRRSSFGDRIKMAIRGEL